MGVLNKSFPSFQAVWSSVAFPAGTQVCFSPSCRNTDPFAAELGATRAVSHLIVVAVLQMRSVDLSKSDHAPLGWEGRVCDSSSGRLDPEAQACHPLWKPIWHFLVPGVVHSHSPKSWCSSRPLGVQRLVRGLSAMSSPPLPFPPCGTEHLANHIH